MSVGSLLHGSRRSISLSTFLEAREWLGLAPPRVEAICLLIVAGKVSTADNLYKKWYDVGGY